MSYMSCISCVSCMSCTHAYCALNGFDVHHLFHAFTLYIYTVHIADVVSDVMYIAQYVCSRCAKEATLTKLQGVDNNGPLTFCRSSMFMAPTRQTRDDYHVESGQVTG